MNFWGPNGLFWAWGRVQKLFQVLLMYLFSQAHINVITKTKDPKKIRQDTKIVYNILQGKKVQAEVIEV